MKNKFLNWTATVLALLAVNLLVSCVQKTAGPVSTKGINLPP